MFRFGRVVVLLGVLGVCTACSKKEEPVAATSSAGELVFNKNCKVCHGQGLNGAPIIGNKAMWAPRIAQGEAVLLKHVTEGYGLMPARAGKDGKEGRAYLSDEEILSAIRYEISRVE